MGKSESFVEMGKVQEDLHANDVDVDVDDDELNLNSMLDFVDSHHRDNNNTVIDDDQDLLADVVEDPSLFYGEFPPLPDFQCMSSSSSPSSLTPAPVIKTCSSSSSAASSSVSSAASWAILKSDDAEDDYKDTNNPSSSVAMNIIHQPSSCDRNGNINDVDCMDVMETFGYMDLIGSNEIWCCGGGDDDNDPSSLFENDLFQFNNNQSHESQQSQLQWQQREVEVEVDIRNRSELEKISGGDGGDGGEISEDLAMVFFEWLKSNKESISADDLRNIRLKRSTIESAVKKLGGGKDGMKRLFKLILEWVQNHQLHNINTNHSQFLNINNPNPNNINHQNYSNPMALPPDQTHPWTFPISPPQQPQPPFMATPGMMDTSAFPSMVGYMGDPVMNQTQHDHVFGSTTAPVCPAQSQFTNSIPPLPPASPQQCFRPYENHHTYQHFPGNGEKFVRLGSSATKEARQKRMARQRQLYSHHRHNKNHNHNQQSHQQNQQQLMNQIGSDTNCASDQLATPGNWVYWPSGAGPVASSQQVMPAQPDFSVQSQPSDRLAGMIPQSQNYQRQDQKRQGWKREKNLRFLLQKVLKQSDVGNLGRIVLPKKEAETHLPELDARDGISIPMEDIGTSRVWNMRYRFWPNNKSRMYLLENTGDFVRANGLQEGDFIVIYSDMKCGKYLIRGVKVRQSGPKMETKKSGKGHKTQHGHIGVPSKSGNGHASLLQSKPDTNHKNDNYDEIKRNEKKQLLHAASMRIDENICG